VFKTGENGFDLIAMLVTKFLNVPRFRNVTIACLTEIAAIGHEAEPAMIAPKQITMFKETLTIMQQMVPLASTDLATVYTTAGESEKEFVQNLGLFISTFLKEHGKLLESAEHQAVLMCGLQYLVSVSKVDNVEIFKITLDYWHSLAKDLFEDGSGAAAGTYQPLMLGAAASPRRTFYAPALAELRLVMVMSMAKPEEVLVVECEGEVIREQMKDTEGLEQYKQMREALVYLTHLDYDNTETIMKTKLARQVDGSEYYLNNTWESLNRLCWAIGSISGAMEQDREKKFLVVVIKDLLGMCENMQGKPAKAIIASNIMYIVGQYPRFLREHWKFLKTVVNKLFEFMHEKHEGVQDMACDTFIKIAKSCKKHFVITHVMEARPFVEEILDTIHLHTVDLEKHQGHTFYQAIGHMIFAEENDEKRARLIERLMASSNHIWEQAMAAASANPAVLQDLDSIGKIIDIMKTNVSACSSIGHDFIFQLQKIYMHMLLVYKQMSTNIVAAIQHAGEAGAMQQPIIKQMRIVKKEILRLLGTWIPMSKNHDVVMANIIPSLLEAVLGDYQTSIPQGRDAEVLQTMAKVVETLKGVIQPSAPLIFTSMFEPTLQMITADKETFPEHRVAFYNLLHELMVNCFPAFVEMSPDQWKKLVQAVIWGFQHPIRSVAETSLKILLHMLQAIASTPSVFSQEFFKMFYVEIMTAVFHVAVDSMHYSEMNEHSQVLAYMFLIVEPQPGLPHGQVQAPLNAAQPNNAEYVKQFVGTKLHEWFPHLRAEQLEMTTRGFMAHNRDFKLFKDHLRDFLVETKEEVGQDVRHVYLVERQAELQGAESTKFAGLQHIPGMVAPVEGGAYIGGGGGGAAAAP
jgi:exportin-1